MSKRTATPRWGKFLLFSCLTLVVTTGGVFGIGRQWLREASEVSGMQPAGQVLAATDEQPEGLPDALIFRIKTEFLDLMQAQQVQVSESLIVDGDTVLNGGLTVEGGAAFAGDIAFDAITVSGDISITDGDITAEGSNIDLGDGTITASNIVYEVLAGDGISIDGTQTVTVTNDDRGSAQKIFGKVKVGDVTLTAGSNTAQLQLTAGSGVSLGTDTSDNEITISADNLSGWYKPSSTVVSLITSTNNVGIGTSAPTNKLEIDSGSTNVSGLSFTQLTSGSPSGVGGGKVLSLDSGGRVILVTDQTGDTPTAESVLPDAETGGTLYFNGTNWVSSTNLFHNGGSVGISTTSPAGRFHTYTNAIGTIGAVIQGYSGQTANLQEWRNGAGSILSYIDADGVFNGSANVAGSIDPGLTQGQVAFQGSEGLAGSNNLSWNNTTGNLGIGTSSPVAKFEVSTDTQGQVARFTRATTALQFNLTGSGNSVTSIQKDLQLGVNDVNNYYVELLTSTKLAFGTSNNAYLVYNGTNMLLETRNSGTGDLVINSLGGNVGVGTTSPTARLSVYAATGETAFSSSVNGNVVTHTVDSWNNWNIAGNAKVKIGSSQLESSGGYLKLLAGGTNQHISLTPSGTGNVGIGTTTPAYALDVVGTIRTTKEGSWAEAIRMGVTQQSLIYNHGYALDIRNLYSGGGIYLGAGSSGAAAGSGPLFITTNTVEFGNQGSTAQFYFNKTTGNVSIGTTVAPAKLRVEGGISASGDVNVSGGYTGGGQIAIPSAAISVVRVRNAGTQVNFTSNVGTTYMTFLDSGNFGIGTTAPNTKLHVEAASVGKALAIFNETGDQDILVASASGTNRLRVQSDGSILADSTVTKSTIGKGFAFGTGNTLSGATGNIIALGDTNTAHLSGGGAVAVAIGRRNSSGTTETYTFGAGLSQSSALGMQLGFGTNNGFTSLTSGQTASIQIQSSLADTPYIDLKTANTTRLRVDSAGKVGIGTTSPSTEAKLDVTGSVVATSYPVTPNIYTVNGVTRGTNFFPSDGTGGKASGVFASGIGSSSTAYPIRTLGSWGSVGLVGAANITGGGRTSVGVYAYGLASGAAATSDYVKGSYNLAELTSDVTSFQANLYGTHSRADSTGATSHTAGNIYGSYSQAIGTTNNSVYGGYFTATGGTTNYGVYSAAGTNYFNGNVGIGITNPNYALATSGVTYTSSYFYTNGGWIVGNSGNYGIYKSSTSSGYLGDISGTITGSTIGIAGPTSGNLGLLLRDASSSFVTRAASGQTANIQEWQNTSGTALSVIDANGNVGIGTTNPGSKLSIASLGSSTGTTLVIDANGDVWKDSSSLRYKDNVKLFSDDFTKILQLNPSSFRYTANNITTIGYVAEELDALGLRELVVYDKEGRPDAIRYDKFSIYLLEVLKQQHARISELGHLESDHLPAPKAEPTATEWVGSKLRYIVDVVFTQPVAFLKSVTIGGHLTVNQDTAGTAEIPAGATRVRVTFAEPFTTAPAVQLTPQRPVAGSYSVDSVTTGSFEIVFEQVQAVAVPINWLAVMHAPKTAGTVEVLQQGSVSGATNSDDTESESNTTPLPSVIPSSHPTPTPSPVSTPSVEPQAATPTPTPTATLTTVPSPTPTSE